jgi:uncharacterized membrane protein
MPQPSPFFLDVALYPHRSLPPQGFLILMAVFGIASFATGIIFASIGAWPVLGFFGLDVALFYWAFRLSYRSGRLCEVVRVTRQQLTVQRIQPDGRRKTWSFEPAWARVDLERPDEHDSRLILASGHRRLAIATFLPPEERATFAETLRTAIRAARTYA